MDCQRIILFINYFFLTLYFRQERSEIAKLQESIEEKNRHITEQRQEMRRLTEHLGILVQKLKLEAGLIISLFNNSFYFINEF